MMSSGPVTARIGRSAPNAVECEAGEAAQPNSSKRCPPARGRGRRAGFAPDEPTIAAAHRRAPHLRLGRTDRVLEALIPAVLEQRVSGKDAFRAWRLLVTKFGAPAPGPAPARMRVPPPAEVWRRIPSWEFHLRQRRPRPGPHRGRAVRSAPTRWSGWRLARAERAREALTSLPGVGEWTAAEVAQRAFGDPDALSVGDYHIAKMVGWTLLGHRSTTPAMVELLEPLRPHRHRAVRLLEVSGLARNPRFGARQADSEHARDLLDAHRDYRAERPPGNVAWDKP